MKIRCVLDTSAVCAYHLREPGWHNVRPALESGYRAMHAVNMAEFCYSMVKRKRDLDADGAWQLLVEGGIGQVGLFDRDFLKLTAKIRLRAPALSVGDGFAIALASVTEAPVLTADRAFLQAADFAAIELIR